MAIVILKLEIKGQGTAGHSRSNSAHTQYTKSLPIRVVAQAHAATPLTSADGLGWDVHSTESPKEKVDGGVRRTCINNPRRVGNRDSCLKRFQRDLQSKWLGVRKYTSPRAGIGVNLIVAGTSVADEPHTLGKCIHQLLIEWAS